MRPGGAGRNAPHGNFGGLKPALSGVRAVHGICARLRHARRLRTIPRPAHASHSRLRGAAPGSFRRPPRHRRRRRRAASRRPHAPGPRNFAPRDVTQDHVRRGRGESHRHGPGFTRGRPILECSQWEARPRRGRERPRLRVAGHSESGRSVGGFDMAKLHRRSRCPNGPDSCPDRPGLAVHGLGLVSGRNASPAPFRRRLEGKRLLVGLVAVSRR